MAGKTISLCGLHSFPSNWIEHTVQFLHRSGWIEACRPISISNVAKSLTGLTTEFK